MSPTSSDRGRTGGGGTGRGRPADCWTGSRGCPGPRSRGRAGPRGRARGGGPAWGGAAGAPLPVGEVVAVVEGAARDVPAPDGVRVVRAPGSGDDALAASAVELVAAGPLLVGAAGRGLRARLPAGAAVTGPGWLLERLDENDRLRPI